MVSSGRRRLCVNPFFHGKHTVVPSTNNLPPQVWVPHVDAFHHGLIDFHLAGLVLCPLEVRAFSKSQTGRCFCCEVQEELGTVA